MVTEVGTGALGPPWGEPRPSRTGALDDLADRGGHPSGPGLEAIRQLLRAEQSTAGPPDGAGAKDWGSRGSSFRAAGGRVIDRMWPTASEAQIAAALAEGSTVTRSRFVAFVDRKDVCEDRRPQTQS